MVGGRIVREQLANYHDLSRFNSGESDIDSWLRNSALRASFRDYSRTYVWYYGDGQVVAFFCLSAYAITPEELPKKQARGEQDVIPAFLQTQYLRRTKLRKLQLPATSSWTRLRLTLLIYMRNLALSAPSVQQVRKFVYAL
jgi:hypothetical protein